MNFPVFYTLLMLCAWCSEGKSVQPWQTFNNEKVAQIGFELNKDLRLATREPPRAIATAVVGDARLGKSKSSMKNKTIYRCTMNSMKNKLSQIRPKSKLDLK